MTKFKLTAYCITLITVLIYMQGCGPNGPDDHSGNSSQVTNPQVAGIIVDSLGNPVKGAVVRFIPVSYNPHQLAKILAGSDSAVTDSTGRYAIDSMPADTYNVLADSGTAKLAFQDSVVITTDTQTQAVPTDTLKAPGSLAGIIRLQPGDDSRTVFLIALGTNFFTSPADIIGNFSLASMAEGTYRVRILSTLDDYGVLDTSLSVTAGQNIVLTDTIRLPYTGIPVVTGLIINYDTLRQIVSLTWNKPTTGRTVQSYTIYRKRSDSTSFTAIKSGLADTIYQDSTGVQDQTYEYRIAAVDTNNTVGVMAGGLSVKVVSAFRFAMSFGSKGTSDGQFNEPGEMSVDSSGNIYILDPFNTQGKIHKYSSTGVFIKTWVAGAFDELRDIEISKDTLYVLDRKNKRIKIFNTSGDSLQTWAFADSTDPINFTIKNDQAFILDRQKNHILKYSLTGDSLSMWSGAGGNSFKALKAITTGPNTDNFYVLDSDSLGYVVDTSGTLVSQFKIEQRAVVAASSQWFLLKSGYLIYCGVEVHTIFVIDTNGAMIAQFGKYGSANGQFSWPVSVLESANKIFISDAQNSRIQVFDE